MFQLMSIHFWQCWKKSFLKYESLLWLRCLNNSFCICTEGLERLWKFYQHLKSFHPKIKYTVEVSREQMNFLDGKICQKEGSLQTYLYCKSKYTYQLLHFRYGHRYRYKNWISYGQVIRMKRTFSNEDKASSRLENTEHSFCSRGYKKKMAHSEIQRVQSTNGKNLSRRNEKQYKNVSFILVLTFIQH